jgi:outer membrane lipopolysaccharide assembly protein LptE/RlpB
VKRSWRIFPLIAVILLVTACGYHNPNVYTGPSKTIYLAEWKNRTSELRLNSEIYRSLTRWFQKTGSISTVRQKEGADLILAGEIVFLELPSLSYGANNTTAEVKVRLMVRYILKEIASNKIVLETPSELWTEEYLVSRSSTSTLDNERKALETIIEDLSKKIYQRTITLLPKL